jgi:hypothetical protein
MSFDERRCLRAFSSAEHEQRADDINYLAQLWRSSVRPRRQRRRQRLGCLSSACNAHATQPAFPLSSRRSEISPLFVYAKFLLRT